MDKLEASIWNILLAFAAALIFHGVITGMLVNPDNQVITIGGPILASIGIITTIFVSVQMMELLVERGVWMIFTFVFSYVLPLFVFVYIATQLVQKMLLG